MFEELGGCIFQAVVSSWFLNDRNLEKRIVEEKAELVSLACERSVWFSNDCIVGDATFTMLVIFEQRRSHAHTIFIFIFDELLLLALQFHRSIKYCKYSSLNVKLTGSRCKICSEINRTSNATTTLRHTSMYRDEAARWRDDEAIKEG